MRSIRPALKLKLANDTAIERVWGTDYADIIIGNSRDNTPLGPWRKRRASPAAPAPTTCTAATDDDQLWTDALDQAYGGTGLDTFSTSIQRAIAVGPILGPDTLPGLAREFEPVRQHGAAGPVDHGIGRPRPSAASKHLSLSGEVARNRAGEGIGAAAEKPLTAR